MRGEVYRPPARGEGQNGRGRRYAVVLQTGLARPEHLVVAFTNTSVRETSFRTPVEIAGHGTLVMCDQIATVALNHPAEPASFLTLEEMQRVDHAVSRAQR